MPIVMQSVLSDSAITSARCPSRRIISMLLPTSHCAGPIRYHVRQSRSMSLSPTIITSSSRHICSRLMAIESSAPDQNNTVAQHCHPQLDRLEEISCQSKIYSQWHSGVCDILIACTATSTDILRTISYLAMSVAGFSSLVSSYYRTVVAIIWP